MSVELIGGGECLLYFERQVWEQGFVRVAGVDEAGRGPLCGPVVAAAFFFDPSFLKAEQYGLLAGLTDSKQLTASQRNAFYERLIALPAVAYGIGVCDASVIDQINILQATHRAMREAVVAIHPLPDHVLVDGLPVKGFPCPSTAITGGDGRSLSIAAASVIAKVTRDRMMEAYDRDYPQYGFARHKGYGTRAHMQALFEYGPCPLHRRSFRPVRDAILIHERGKPKEE